MISNDDDGNAKSKADGEFRGAKVAEYSREGRVIADVAYNHPNDKGDGGER